MSELLSAADWADYTNMVNDAGDTFNKEVITWRRLSMGLDDNGEEAVASYTDIELEVLIAYNYFRTWPISAETTGGEIDKESMVVFINMQYLRDLGYLTAKDYFDFDPGKDRFLVSGDTWQSAGDTHAAQASTNPVLFQIIMRREKDQATGKPIYP